MPGLLFVPSHPPDTIPLAPSRSAAHVMEMRAPEEESADIRLAAIQAGDTQAFDTLCLAYAERLWRFAFSIVRSREVAQDVVQDVLLDLWDRRARLVITTTLTAYLFGAVRRRTLVYLRNERTTSRIAETWMPTGIPALGRSPELPDTILERDDLQRHLAHALASLPDIRRHILALRWDQHLEYDEIAHIMGISQDAARAHVSRGYRALRDVLRKAGIEPPGA